MAVGVPAMTMAALAHVVVRMANVFSSPIHDEIISTKGMRLIFTCSNSDVSVDESS